MPCPRSQGEQRSVVGDDDDNNDVYFFCWFFDQLMQEAWIKLSSLHDKESFGREVKSKRAGKEMKGEIGMDGWMD